MPALNQFHRSQIGRAQRYIRRHLNEPLTLARIAKEAGCSAFHFARLFLAYTGETPFELLRRMRLAVALRLLHDKPRESITEIALIIGYETSAAFNKVFKKTLHMNPSDFRKLGKEQQRSILYDLSKPRFNTEITMNLTPDFETVTRALENFVYVEKHGPFAEMAPPAWSELFVLLREVDESLIVDHLGLGTIDKSKLGEESMIYQAGVTLSSLPEKLPKGLRHRDVETGSYACFVLTGSYSHIGAAFNQIFKTLAERNVPLRRGFSIEDYRNDPKITPEDQLITELLIPIA